MWDLRNKINEQTKQKHRLIDNSEQTEGCQMRKSRRIGEKGEGIQKKTLYTESSMVITEGKRGGEGRRG